MNHAFVETPNVTAFRRAAGNMVSRKRPGAGFMVVQGKAGWGKTVTAQHWYAKSGGYFLRVWQDWSQHALLQALCLEVVGVKLWGVDNCKRTIVDQLAASHQAGQPAQAIIVDEADRLKIDRIEDFRDINEASGVPFILIGEEHLKARFAGRQRIFRRVAEEVEFGPVSATDLVAYGAKAAGLKITPEAGAKMAEAAGGSFGLADGYIKDLAVFVAANGLATVDAATLEKSGLLPAERRRK